jgi:hypothetical protein
MILNPNMYSDRSKEGGGVSPLLALSTTLYYKKVVLVVLTHQKSVQYSAFIWNFWSPSVNPCNCAWFCPGRLCMYGPCGKPDSR